LFQGQWQRHQANQNRKHDDGDTHVVEEDHIQYQQGIEHGPNDYFGPDGKDYFQEAPAF